MRKIKYVTSLPEKVGGDDEPHRHVKYITDVSMLQFTIVERYS